jgi:hypothetical protein
LLVLSHAEQDVEKSSRDPHRKYKAVRVWGRSQRLKRQKECSGTRQSVHKGPRSWAELRWGSDLSHGSSYLDAVLNGKAQSRKLCWVLLQGLSIQRNSAVNSQWGKKN